MNSPLPYPLTAFSPPDYLPNIAAFYRRTQNHANSGLRILR